MHAIIGLPPLHQRLPPLHPAQMETETSPSCWVYRQPLYAASSHSMPLVEFGPRPLSRGRDVTQEAPVSGYAEKTVLC